MSRIRTIKPELTLDEDLAILGFAARYFFINLLCHVDREGRCEDRPKMLHALILPWDKKVDADQLISELTPHFVIRYEVNGKKYLCVRNFFRHQRPNSREPKSEIPPPPKTASARACTDLHAHAPTDTRMHERNGREGEGKGKGREGNGGVPESARNAHPTIEQVKAYCKEQKLSVDPERWMNHYQANGWKVGKNPMSDWRAALRYWERNGIDTPQTPSVTPPPRYQETCGPDRCAHKKPDGSKCDYCLDVFDPNKELAPLPENIKKLLKR